METTIFGHRGIPEKYVENSLDGFQYLAEHGEAVEFDVQLTKDNQPVIMHDEKIDRTTNGQGYIKDFTLNELQMFELQVDPKRPGQSKPKHPLIPTLFEVLDIFKDTDIFMNIEIKTDNIYYPGIEQITLDAVAAAGLENQVLFSSFDLPTMEKLKALDPTKSIALIIRDVIENPIEFMKAHELVAFHLKKTILDGQHLDIERPWTINTTEEMRKIVEAGYVGLFTDDFEKAMLIRDELK